MPIAEGSSASEVGVQQGDVSTLDMASLLLCAYELGDWINQSAEVADYVYWKTAVKEDEAVGPLMRQFAQAKELFAECERFGRFHPNYHEAKDRMKHAERELDAVECVRRFKQAEQAVDAMLHEVSRTIAEAVSETIKVPSNEQSGGGCGSGGSCGCGSGGCG